MIEQTNFIYQIYLDVVFVLKCSKCGFRANGGESLHIVCVGGVIFRLVLSHLNVCSVSVFVFKQA